ncbi:FtsB family cell division protein [Longispora albida]|uniref:FtsB family cell division protein n=1 Tax=Longispora albida TaxID=203523 RepID=UPI0003818651|nr:septum formation initiator family protein [Longispora albida]
MTRSPGSRGPSRRPGRSAARPAAARRPAAPGAAQRTRPPRQKRLTGRAAVLGLLLAALMLAYAYPVRTYLTQNAEMSRLQQQLADQQVRIERLNERYKKWDDPAYFTQQARERLQLVLPGDTAYRISGTPATGQPDADASGRGKSAGEGTWYGKLWSSTKAADKPRRK